MIGPVTPTPLGPTPQGNTTPATSAISPIRLLTEGGRLLLDAAVIPEKLPSLIVGEQVTARIAEKLDNNQVAVLIKNGLFTLNMPKGMQISGDTLNLRVATLRPDLSFALVEAGGEQAKDSSVEVSLSRASRYLTDLLRSGEGSPSSKNLNLDAARQTPTHLAQTMRHDVQKSGLFYESHLKAWEEGRMPLETLREEPQARLTAALSNPRHPAADQAHVELGKLVQQQLATQENHQIPLQGFAWPGQPMSILIEQEATDEREGRGDSDMEAWTTSMSLSLPALGSLNARLRMVGGAVQVTFAADSDSAGELIRANARRLEEGFELAGLQLASLVVKHETTE